MSAKSKKLFITAGLVLVLALVALGGPVRSGLLGGVEVIQDLGTLGAGLFALLYIAATVAAMPASLLTVAAGLLYGTSWATPLVLGASLSGATLSFLLARSRMRPWIMSRYGDSRALRVIESRCEKDGAKLVFLLRLSPLVPFSILNYLLGLTGVSLRSYVVSSAVGMVPGILLYTYIGSTLGSLGQLAAGDTGTSPMKMVLFGVGLAATLAVTLVLTRWSSQALEEDSKG